MKKSLLLAACCIMAAIFTCNTVNAQNSVELTSSFWKSNHYTGANAWYIEYTSSEAITQPIQISGIVQFNAIKTVPFDITIPAGATSSGPFLLLVDYAAYDFWHIRVLSVSPTSWNKKNISYEVMQWIYN